MDSGLSRQIWHAIEFVNAVTYFAPECRGAAKDLGLRGFWMGYFGCRAAPMGVVNAEVVEAAFYNFHPAVVRRAIPDAWTFAAPDVIVRARSRAAAAAVRRLVPDADALGSAVVPLLTKAIEQTETAGRPLFDANREAAFDGGIVGELWQRATTLREHRGDGHVAVLTEAELDGCEAHVLYAATEGVAPETLRENRGWSVDEWEQAVDRLRGRRLLGADGVATDGGDRLRRRVEQRTDELAMPPYRALSDGELARVVQGLRPIAEPIAASGEIPFPNPIGLPRPDLNSARQSAHFR